MKLLCILFVVSVVVLQWNSASSRYVSPTSHSKRPRSFDRTRSHGHSSLNQQLPLHLARRKTVFRHSNLHQSMSYRAHGQPISDPTLTQSRLPSTASRGFVTPEEDEKVTGISVGTRAARRHGLRTRHMNPQFVHRPVPRQQYKFSQPRVNRRRKPMHNIFIRTKSGRKIRISHSFGNTNIVLNTASINNRKFQNHFSQFQGQKKRFSDSRKIMSHHSISSPTAIEKNINDIWTEAVSPVKLNPNKVSAITKTPVADTTVSDGTNIPVQIGSSVLKATANVKSSISTNSTAILPVNTNTTSNSIDPVISNKTDNKTSNKNERKIHKSISYRHVERTPTTRTSSLSTKITPITNTKPTAGSTITKINDAQGITKQPSITTTNTRNDSGIHLSSSITGDDGTVDLPDSLVEDVDGIDTPDGPDLHD